MEYISGESAAAVRTTLVALAAAATGLYVVGALAGVSASLTPQGASLGEDAKAGRRRSGARPGESSDAAIKSTTSSGVGAPGSGPANYESSKAVDEYLLFHFAPVRAGRAPCAARLTALARRRSS